VWSRCIWLRTGAGGRFLWTWQWTFGVHEKWGVSWLVKWLLASQEGLYFMELVTNYLRFIMKWHFKIPQ